MWCWGPNHVGQLGDGTTVNRIEPAPTLEMPPVRQLSVESTFSCAVVEGGAVRCWGRSVLGRGIDLTIEPFSAITAPMPPASFVDTEFGTACAVTKEHDLYCWGDNHFDAMGLGVESYSFAIAPVHVDEAGKVEQVALGDQHICVLRTDGSVWCAGHPSAVGSQRPFGQGTAWGPVDLGL